MPCADCIKENKTMTAISFAVGIAAGTAAAYLLLRYVKKD
jgi:hypothetical protein